MGAECGFGAEEHWRPQGRKCQARPGPSSLSFAVLGADYGMGIGRLLPSLPPTPQGRTLLPVWGTGEKQRAPPQGPTQPRGQQPGHGDHSSGLCSCVPREGRGRTTHAIVTPWHLFIASLSCLCVCRAVLSLCVGCTSCVPHSLLGPHPPLTGTPDHRAGQQRCQGWGAHAAAG